MLGFIGAGVWLLAGMIAPRLAGSAVAAATTMAAPESRESRPIEGYEWVDRERGIVRIPVERAMDLIAEDR
jgi:hypothetical protein